MLTRATAFAVIALLAACQTAPQEEELAPSPILPGTYMTPETDFGQNTGLQEREPDLCGAKQYVFALGQPASVIPTLSLGDTPFRIVEWRGVEDQMYKAGRIVFRLDQNDNIYNIDCG